MIKKLLTLAIVSCIANLALGQSIPNGGFENWTTTVYQSPQNYFVSSLQNNHNHVNPVNVTQDTSHYHGLYSAKLTTMLSGNDTAYAYIANGDPSHPAGQGVPISQKPTGMRLYYKCDVMVGDTAVIIVEFKKAGSIIGQSIQKIVGVKNSFTLLSVPFALALTPDSLIFAAISSNLLQGSSGFKGIPGSMLQIDSLSFTGLTTQPANFNGDFENWQTTSNSVLQSWEVSSTNGAPTQTTDAYKGTYALELQTLSTNNAGDTAFTASATTGHSIMNGTGGGLPYSLTTDTLFFNYKYAPHDVNDSAEVILMFKKTGFTPKYVSQQLKASSTYLQVALGYTLTQTPDTVIVFINSSKNNNVPSSYVGADLKIDNMYLKSQGIPAAALNFDGVNDYVKTSVFNTAVNNITVEAAVKWNGGTASNQLIFTNGNTGNAGYGVFVDHGNGNKLSGIAGGVAVMSSNAQLTAGTWQMVSLVCNNGTWVLYVDGVSYSLTGNTTVPNPVVGSFAIGSNQGGTENFNGSMDEVRFWNRPLCAAEIQNNLHGEVTGGGGLIAYYNFNEGIDNNDNSAVTTLNDVSGNNYNATLNNFALTGTTSNWTADAAVATGSMVPVFSNTLSAVTTQTNVICKGGSSGTASVVSVTGVGSPYSYAWSSGGGSNIETGLAAANYTCTISNTCGASITETFTITEPAQPLMASSASGTIACNGGVTTVTVSATGGISPYAGSGTFTATANSYTYTVTDDNSCTATTTLTIGQPTQIMVTATTGTINCNGGVTTVTVSATGGTPAYTGLGTYTVAANTYTYTVTDANSCSMSTTVTVTEPNAIATTQSPTVCAGSGVMVGSHFYTTAGTYTDVLTAHNGCDSTVTTNLTVNQITAAFTYSLISCCNQISYFDSSYYSAGNSPVSWNWTFTSVSGGYPFQTSTQQNPLMYMGFGNNTVCLKVTSASGCVDSICKTVNETVQGINQYSNAPMLNVYPNPAQNNFTIETNSTEKQLVELFDVNGKLVLSQSINGKTNIDASVLAQGVYNISLTSQYGVTNKRLVIFK